MINIDYSLRSDKNYVKGYSANNAADKKGSAVGFIDSSAAYFAEVSAEAEKVSALKLSPEDEMLAFKKEFYDDLAKITFHRTVSNGAVNISEKAFENMKSDPQYREKVLSLIKRDLGSSYGPRNNSVMITVGADLDDYRADSWPVGYDSEFAIRSRGSFIAVGDNEDDDGRIEQKELLEVYAEKRMRTKRFQYRAAERELLNEKLAEQELERMRVMQTGLCGVL